MKSSLEVSLGCSRHKGDRLSDILVSLINTSSHWLMIAMLHMFVYKHNTIKQ